MKPDGYERAVAVAGSRHPPARRPRSRPIYRDYEREKRKRGLVDFDDLITGCADVLERDTEFAAAQRWRFRHLFVDEFQDASAAQFRLLRAPGSATAATCAWSATPTRRSTASPAPTRRTSPASAAGSRPSASPTSGSCGSAATTGRPPRSSRPRARCSAPPGRRRPAVHAAASRRAPPRRSTSTTPPRTKPVASRGRCGTPRARSCAWSRMAVLYRVNAQSALFEEALARAGVPFRVRGGGRFLDRPEVKVALDDLRKTAARGTGAPLRRAPHRLRHRRRGPGRGTPRARRRARCGSATSTSRPTAAAAASTASSSSCRRRCAATTPARRRATRSSCSRSTGRRASSSTPCSSPGSSVGWSRSRTPRPREAMDEEQRLLYVALSRAERVLHLSWARERTVGWPHRAAQRGAAGSPASRTADHPGPTPPPAPGDARRSIADARDTVAPRQRRQHARQGAGRRRRGRRTALRGAGRLAPAPVPRRRARPPT